METHLPNHGLTCYFGTLGWFTQEGTSLNVNSLSWRLNFVRIHLLCASCLRYPQPWMRWQVCEGGPAEFGIRCDSSRVLVEAPGRRARLAAMPMELSFWWMIGKLSVRGSRPLTNELWAFACSTGLRVLFDGLSPCMAFMEWQTPRSQINCREQVPGSNARAEDY